MMAEVRFYVTVNKVLRIVADHEKSDENTVKYMYMAVE